MAYIATLKKNNTVIYPQTKSTAVYEDDGVTSLDSVVVRKSELLDLVYPVGSIFMSATLSTTAAVATALGGTWVAWGSGRVPVGVDTSDSDFDTVEETGGEKTHTLTVAEMPSHRHKEQGFYGLGSDTSGGREARSRNVLSADPIENGASLATGGDGAHNNLQPYITCYMYKRTA